MTMSTSAGNTMVPDKYAGIERRRSAARIIPVAFGLLAAAAALWMVQGAVAEYSGHDLAGDRAKPQSASARMIGGDGLYGEAPYAAENRSQIDVPDMLRSLATHWLDGKIADEEYFAAISYLCRHGYLNAGTDSGLGTSGMAAGAEATAAETADAAPTAAAGAAGAGAAAGSPSQYRAIGTLGDGPAGSSQAWCKPGLQLALDIKTWDKACVLPTHADGAMFGME